MQKKKKKNPQYSPVKMAFRNVFNNKTSSTNEKTGMEHLHVVGENVIHSLYKTIQKSLRNI